MFLSMSATLPNPCLEQVERFELASKQSGVSHDAVAHMQGISPEQWYQQRHGVGHVSLRRLSTIAQYPEGRQFLAKYYLLLAEEWGLTDVPLAMEAGRGLMALIDRIQCRAVKADLREHEERKRA